MLRILLAEAELERVPDSIAGHPVIRRHAQGQGKKPGQLILDQNHHGQAMRDLAEGDRRGRPDITHYTLLCILESPLCRDGGVEVAVHTRHGELIHIRPDTRLPRGEQRFQGLMAKVLAEGRSQDKDPLLRLEVAPSPRDALRLFQKGPVLRFDEGGKVLDPADLRAAAPKGDLTVILGAYPAGPWSDAWQEAAPQTASIHQEALNAWAVASEVCAWWRLSAPAP